MTSYYWFRIRAASRTWTESYKKLQHDGIGGAEVWGAFQGLFGIGSNELVLMVHCEGEPPIGNITGAGFEVIESHAFVPTVRPESFEPLTKSGLYVFRFFDVAHKDVDEIAQLSKQAWTTFENAEAYTAEPIGLFGQADRSGPSGVMLLLTWYDGFESWQTSRRPAPDARENFRQRRELTKGTIAYATKLVGSD